MEKEVSEPQSTFCTKMIFISFGFSTLLAWNAFISELPFFQYFLEDMNPNVSFAFLNYILNISFQFLLVWKKDLFSLKFQLFVGLIGSIAFIIAIPSCTMLLGKNELHNILISGGLIVLMGFINALCQAGFFNFVSHFPLEMIVALSTGQGFSGIVMNIIQYIVMACVVIEDEETKLVTCAWIFFGISAFILLMNLIILFVCLNSDYFKYYLNEKKNNIEMTNEENSLNQKEEEQETNTEVTETNSTPKEISFKELFFKIWDLNMLMVFLYIVTFSLFPNVLISQKLFSLDAYKVNTILITYNSFDTIGRYIVGFLTPNKKTNMSIIIGRSILIFTSIFNYYCQERLEWDINITSILLLINTALLACTNGMATSLSFGLAPLSVEDEYKGQAGTSLSFFLIVGLFLGSIIAFGVGEILSIIKQ